MTYRELLKLYRQGKLEEDKKKEVEAEIEKQDAISEFLYQEGEIPGLEDLKEQEDTEPTKNLIAASDTEKNAGTGQNNDFDNRFVKEIRHSIRKAFIKMGVVTGAIVLTVILCAVFVLPRVVSAIYYDPNEVVGEYEDLVTTRMDLDLSVYSELFLPGNYRNQVSAVPRGYGEYDITIPQNMSWTGKFTSVSGRLVRGELTLYDKNILSRPSMQFYLPGDETAWEAWEVDENGKETKMDTEARKKESIQYSKEEIEGYNDNDWYTAFVSIEKIMEYKDFIECFQNLSDSKNLEWGTLWCAVHTENEDGYCIEPNIGFCPFAAGMSMSWDKEKYPYLSLNDDWDSQEDVDETDEKIMQSHFISMLSYMREHKEILTMMDQAADDTDRYQEMIDYVKKNGLKIHGFAISAKKDTLLELYKEDVVSYIQTTPQN